MKKDKVDYIKLVDMKNQRFCFALDLINDSELIREYENYHKNVWPEIEDAIINSGVEKLEIYRIKTRLFMILETDANFSLEKKNQLDQKNPIVQEWENLMWKYQKSLPGSKPGEKWVLMDKIFELEKDN